MAQAAPAVIKLFDEDGSHVQSRAAGVLGSWGAVNNAAPLVLSNRVSGNAQPAVEYLERAAEGDPRPPSPDPARILADAIRPRKRDSEEVSTLRELVFQWVWNAAQYTGN